MKKLLIANRGEIAARVIATAQKRGLRTVAVYSDPDAAALHVGMADEAVRIGAAQASESYLKIDAILSAAERTGADAIHPGYGFLSENPDLVDACNRTGLTFVGPPGSAIRAMGLKDAAKAAMEQAGVPVVPGYHKEAQDLEALAHAADEIGYPVLIKARAGGGGKGMRLVEAPEDFAPALAAAQREGQASFGDPAVLVEKYVSTPRHIEIQIMADAHGNVVHLFERDCSLQRRHQKVIEEAPAPDMPDDVRAAMGKAATDAARAIGYQGAGTVEFIADGSGPLRKDGFWFMEMNTRLQVEHPVTEAITGLDLVALQLDIAAGAALPFTQDDLMIKGHAFEARIYAEDVPAGFLPATGRITHLRLPEEAAPFENASIRVDAGIRQGDEISPHYDPMLAKLIVHGPTRQSALAKLATALAQTHIAGVTTNTGFLSRLARHDGFARGDVDTGLIARDLDQLTEAASPSTQTRVLQAAALAALELPDVSGSDPWTRLSGWRAWGLAAHTATLEHAGEILGVTVTVAGDHVTVDGVPLLAKRQANTLRITTEGQTYTLGIHRHDHTITIFADGETFVFTVPDPLDQASSAGAAADHILAPMPGLVTQMLVKAGERVTEGQPLLVLEAMKMEHTLTAPRDGTLLDVCASDGDQVTNGALLVQFESLADV